MYAQLSSVNLYYERQGTGDKPLLLLHGAMGGAYAFRMQVPTLGEHYRLFLPEQRGRGRSPDVEGPFHYEVLARDTIEFIDAVIQQPVPIVGVSDGGIIGLFIALMRPDLVTKLVTVGANFHKDGLIWRGLESLDPNDNDLKMPRQLYSQVSPDGPGHWPVIIEKIKQMALSEPTLTTAELANISCPVLVMVGDDDIVSHHHTIDLYESLKSGQLAIVPGASHLCFMEKPEVVNQTILSFLAEDAAPATAQPVRRT